MAIEFPCTLCGRMLRTGDDTAGQQARCPECGGVVPIPAASTVPPTAPPEAPQAGPGPTLEGQVLPAVPFGADLRAYAASRLAPPAVLLLALSGFTILVQLLVMIGSLIGLGFWGLTAKEADRPGVLAVGSVALATQAAAVLVHLGVVLGASMMLRRRSYSLAVAGAVLAILPVSCAAGPAVAFCCLPLWLIDMAVGVWALAVLSDPLVKAAFQNRT